MRPTRIFFFGRHCATNCCTARAPADYALGADGQILGVVEAKRLSLGPQNVLTQAERYSLGATTNRLNYRGYRIPFLYSTNGEIIWRADVRHPLNRSRKVAAFHTPNALRSQSGSYAPRLRFSSKEYDASSGYEVPDNLTQKSLAKTDRMLQYASEQVFGK
jgi:type I restriction enzyme R subunit